MFVPIPMCVLLALPSHTPPLLPGLGLYYLSNTAITTLVQLWLRKLGGADVQINELGPITKVGTGMSFCAHRHLRNYLWLADSRTNM